MKKKIFSTILMLFGLSLGSFAQELTLDSFELNPVDMTAKINPVLDLNDEPCALIKVAIASEEVTFQGNIVNVPTRQAGEWLLYVPAKTRRIKVSCEGCLPLLVELSTLPESNRTYSLRISLPEVADAKPRTMLVMPTYSSDGVQSSFGAMVAYYKRYGIFVRYKSNFTSLDTVTTLSDDGIDESGVSRWLSGEQKSNRWALTAGYVQRLYKPLYIYIGGGYGARTLGWEMTTGEYGKVSSTSYEGYEFDAGVILQLGEIISISAGMQTNQFNNYELNIGVGAKF